METLTKAEHAKLPLKRLNVFHPGKALVGSVEHIWAADGKLVAQNVEPETAEFIVRACNSYYELLKVSKSRK